MLRVFRRYLCIHEYDFNDFACLDVLAFLG